MNSVVTQEDIYQKFLNLTNTTSLAELRALPSEDLQLANAQQVAYDSPYGSFTYGPVVDGLFAPLQPSQLLAQGRFDKDVRVMVGHNANEGQLFTPYFLQTEDQLRYQIEEAFANAPKQSIDYITETLYPPVFDGSLGYTNNLERGRLIIAEGVFTCNTNYLSRAYGNRTYSYLFAIPPAIHGQDIPYTYYEGGATTALPTGVQNRTIALALQDFITSFAENGVPDAQGIKQFNMYGEDAKVLELNITGIEEIRDSNANVRCAWWQKALY
jgi:carboxylesterase type B